MSNIINIAITELNENVNFDITEVQEVVNIQISEVGVKGDKGDVNLIKVSGESIPSHTPIAIINNLAYKMDASNPLHQFAFVGFSTNGTLMGENCIIQQLGEISLPLWGLIPNTQYLSGVNGLITTTNASLTNFTKVIGFATNTTTMQIIKDSITINK